MTGIGIARASSRIRRHLISPISITILELSVSVKKNMSQTNCTIHGEKVTNLVELNSLTMPSLQTFVSREDIEWVENDSIKGDIRLL
jgi:hypothetical protein